MCQLGTVNRRFRHVIHAMAVGQLIKMSNSGRVSKSVLEKLGWTEPYHRHHSEELGADGCSCIDIAYRYKPIRGDKMNGLISKIELPLTYDAFLGRFSFSEKVYSSLSRRGEMSECPWSLDRRNSEWTKLLLPPFDQADEYMHNYCYCYTYARMLVLRACVTIQYKIYIFDQASHRYCTELEYADDIPNRENDEIERRKVSDICLTKDTLAVQIRCSPRGDFTLFYKINADDPSVKPQFTSAVTHGLIDGGIHLNDYFLVYHWYSNMFDGSVDSNISYYDRRRGFANPPAEMKIRRHKDSARQLHLEPEKSSFVIFTQVEESIVCLYDIEKKQHLFTWDLSSPGIYGNWFAGIFLALSVVSSCKDTQTAKVRICILDPLAVEKNDNNNCISYGKTLTVRGNIEDENEAYLDSDGVVLSTYSYAGDDKLFLSEVNST